MYQMGMKTFYMVEWFPFPTRLHERHVHMMRRRRCNPPVIHVCQGFHGQVQASFFARDLKLNSMFRYMKRAWFASETPLPFASSWGLRMVWGESGGDGWESWRYSFQGMHGAMAMVTEERPWPGAWQRPLLCSCIAKYSAVFEEEGKPLNPKP